MLARIRARLRPMRALAEFCRWSIALLLARLRPERTRVPAQARAMMGIGYSKARLSPSLAKAHIGESSRGPANAVQSRETTL
jgi:hypothetical protein